MSARLTNVILSPIMYPCQVGAAAIKASVKDTIRRRKKGLYLLYSPRPKKAGKVNGIIGSVAALVIKKSLHCQKRERAVFVKKVRE